jgi:hypothetical protein
METPPWKDVTEDHRIFCHLPMEILSSFDPVITQPKEEM